MKKFMVVFVSIVVSFLFFAGCSKAVRPYIATANPITSAGKMGKASITYLMGFIPLGEDNLGIDRITRENRISKVSFVDVESRVDMLGLLVTYTVYVYGE